MFIDSAADDLPQYHQIITIHVLPVWPGDHRHPHCHPHCHRHQHRHGYSRDNRTALLPNVHVFVLLDFFPKDQSQHYSCPRYFWEGIVLLEFFPIVLMDSVLVAQSQYFSCPWYFRERSLSYWIELNWIELDNKGEERRILGEKDVCFSKYKGLRWWWWWWYTFF